MLLKTRTRKKGFYKATSKSAVSRVSKPADCTTAGVLPTWKSAIQQVWKPALQRPAVVALKNPRVFAPWCLCVKNLKVT
jgi:hypothetical protein